MAISRSGMTFMGDMTFPLNEGANSSAPKLAIKIDAPFLAEFRQVLRLPGEQDFPDQKVELPFRPV
jgi:hypothetical protein